jgi:hypothetical protein
MHPHHKTPLYHIQTKYHITFYRSTVATSDIMTDDDDDDTQLLYVCSLVVLAESNLTAAALANKRRLLVNDTNSKEKIGRKLCDRPVYEYSTWWMMLEKGDCKLPGHAHNKLFTRRFRLPFSMFRDIVEEAREWPGQNGKNLRERGKYCVGVYGVPLELKVLGALRMSAKGCTFDSIAELSGMSISIFL